jgi:hypothetical protein
MQLVSIKNPKPEKLYRITYFTAYGLTKRSMVPDYMMEDGFYYDKGKKRAILTVREMMAQSPPN